MTIKKVSRSYTVFRMGQRGDGHHETKPNQTLKFFLGLDSCRLYFISFSLFLILIALWFSGERTPHFQSLFSKSCSA